MLIAVRRHIILFLPSPQIKGTGTSLVLKNMKKSSKKHPKACARVRFYYNDKLRLQIKLLILGIPVIPIQDN